MGNGKVLNYVRERSALGMGDKVTAATGAICALGLMVWSCCMIAGQFADAAAREKAEALEFPPSPVVCFPDLEIDAAGAPTGRELQGFRPGSCNDPAVKAKRTMAGEVWPEIAYNPRQETAVRMLAATMWAEARGEGEEAMRAVGHVIVNRVGQRFGADLRAVIFAPYQFSAWNAGDPNRSLALNPDLAARGRDREGWLMAQTIAREILDGRSIDPTGGALFYHTPEVSPHWAAYGVGARKMAGHVFYADVRPKGAT
jgi:hypothetical protein